MDALDNCRVQKVNFPGRKRGSGGGEEEKDAWADCRAAVPRPDPLLLLALQGEYNTRNGAPESPSGQRAPLIWHFHLQSTHFPL